ncbi:ATP-dependent helicase/nuclease subunit A [Halalkaliarchaeum desulfuricum]|uniref:DNA 3'-5' helicase n=1 Tax=Halalkaliarchaeum desulfuricum TaxID=2055893 RepID=A0A343TGS9_9EURY|nr:UvrD-helicase domain-containing protein [Halalkaliarchaeum desulfuricum]AUX08301.1 ATP-dependent helicase/nuclease subunit A [Halalkaliarchaeum desulfuricum]
MTDDTEGDDIDPLVLKDAQRAIREAYFDHETGLFTLNCVPGSGKSVVAHHLAAEDILRRYVAGDPTPEQHVAVISFNRDEAADIIPDVCDRLRTIVEHELVPAASEVSEEELQYLLQRVRQAPYVGTIDSLLRGLLQEVAHDVGFDEMPSVGNDALLKRVHRDCYEALRNDSEYEQRVLELETAYPAGEYDDSVAEMLEAAVTYCRDQSLSTAEFRSELERTRNSTYPDGKPDSFDDIVRSVECFHGNDNEIGEKVRDAVEGSDRERLVEADRELYEEWCDRIDDICTLLSAYRSTYRATVREYGVVSHTDVAYLVDAYFDESDDRSHLPGPIRTIDRSHRRRILQKYRSRIRSLVIDEAQDVSAIQHAALSHIVTADSRVFACGDVLQGIYLWRHADPAWFDAATTDGEYLGVDWDTHENRTATTTYRCVPDIAAGINAIAEPMFTDPARGGIGHLDTSYPPLDAAREGDDSPAIHVSSFTGVGHPGSETWANPDCEVGEANMLATHISRGFADGTFCDEDGEPLNVTVLFRRGTRMSDYENAFAAEGLRVHTRGEGLFDCPAVETVFAVCDWLTRPGSPERTEALLTESPLDVVEDSNVFKAHSWDIDRVLDDDAAEFTEAQRRTLRELRRLRDRSDFFQRHPASVYVEEITEALALRADPYEIVAGTDPEQRVANLDALVETLTQWEGETHYPPSELTDLVQPFRDDPDDGPAQPSTTGATYDVEFRTAHSAKGDQDDVIVIADPGFDIWSRGAHTQRFITQGPIAGIAPPTNTNIPCDITIPSFDGGLYENPGGWDRDTGLRWATARWLDSVSDTASCDELVGPNRLRRVVSEERAEAWRLLYVALTRARDHLVVPLPRSDLEEDQLRDRWLDTIRDGLEYDHRGTDSYILEIDNSDPNRDVIEIGVNDADLFADWWPTTSETPNNEISKSPPHRDSLERWIPRFLNPSTMYPLTETLDEHTIAHLLGEPLHTDTNDVPDDLPLQFDLLGPEEVGSCLHAVLTELVVRDVPERSLRTVGPEVRRTFDEVLTAATPRVGEDEREGMFTFFESVLEDFLESDLWSLIQNPETEVSVERPIDGLVEIADVEFEIHGQADFVVELPSGKRHVADVKITLTDQTPESRRRYELQVTTYSYLLEQQGISPPLVSRAVETLGVDRDTIESAWPSQIVERRLAALIRQ